MTLQQTINEIERIIQQTPYTKEEVLSFFEAEKELNVDEVHKMLDLIEKTAKEIDLKINKALK